MLVNMDESYFKYWGKAKRNAEDDGEAYHLLAYHSLDVAAVANVWWKQSSVIRNIFTSTGQKNEKVTYAWLMFFIALHDLGKFDVRFQMKVPSIAQSLFSHFVDSDDSQYRKYWHGEYSYYWLFDDFSTEFDWKSSGWLEAEGADTWECWKPWIRAVAGHHGVEPFDLDGFSKPRADTAVLEHDRDARKSFVFALESLFLVPASLSLKDQPPTCDFLFLAGFCSVCDWLGSTTQNVEGDSFFTFSKGSPDLTKDNHLQEYFESKLPIANQLLKESGLLQTVKTLGGMQSLFPEFIPHQVQTLVEKIPVIAGLTLIEAPTGSGKTEAALAYASHLLAEGIAESIIFALPTQATANAMLKRLIDVSESLYEGADLVLAHGKAHFNDLFIDLKATSKSNPSQNKEHELEASIQCSQWLGQSRKRVFLGQIGVCTIDQVLISVLPVKHRFVRSFGLGKSILIVDEVHAYDSYMYGLLNEVLKRQKTMNSSVILLSATLPLFQREKLMSTWGDEVDVFTEDDKYPLISHINDTKPFLYPLEEQELQKLKQKPKRVVKIASLETPDMLPDTQLVKRIIQAASEGANVVIICNLVADAQALALSLRSKTALSVDLFHSRYRFKDRQDKENAVLESYGKGDQRKQGGILVATQVVEQSLDLDFDWMITQLCPMDLLFQRLGRLHRHDRARPEGFEEPQCTVLFPEKEDYQLHKLIYGNKKAPNSRVLWRTEQLIKRAINKKSELHFPDVYRPMIEEVYKEEVWVDEPESVTKEYEVFQMEEEASRMIATSYTKIESVWDDEDSNVNALTRDGEMSLNIIPVVSTNNENYLIGETQSISSIDEWKQLEELMLNTIPVPATWEGSLQGIAEKEDGVFYLAMLPDGDSWQVSGNEASYRYSIENGLEREKHETTKEN